ncbi:hypothetical protein [Vibrio halioticoli]|uniref:hypothetical protein n=1 Tax=Vibrio halioticoli TaxID=71388 RepID=UPI0012EB3CBD|nr:hypothetical protein [Vibrio halioticoli]
MLRKLWRTKTTNPDQDRLFPFVLDSSTEFWAIWEDTEIFAIQHAMIVQALNEIKDHRRSKKMRQEAWDWLFSNEEHPFCARLCASNNCLDIHHLRTLVRRMVNNI